MKIAIAAAVCTVASLAFVGCASKQEEGVKTTYRSQYTTTTADVKTTTEAARSVFEEADLKDVKADSTSVDGKATGKKADGTEVKAYITRDGTSASASKVQVTVGLTGEPTLGANLANKIKTKADGTGSGSVKSGM